MSGLDSTKSARRKPLLCLLNLHHKWRWESAPDGGRYRRCANCGKDRDEDLDIPVELM